MMLTRETLEPALLDVVKASQHDLARGLIELGARGTLADTTAEKNHALHIAASQCDARMINILLDGKADPRVKNGSGKYFFVIAAEVGLYKYVINFSNLLQEDEKSYAYAVSIYQATIKNDVTRLAILLELSVGIAMQWLQTPLDYVIHSMKGDKTLLELLIKYRVGISTLNISGHSPVEAAARLSQWKTVELFAEKGIIMLDREGHEKALMCALAICVNKNSPSFPAVKALLKAGVNPDCTPDILLYLNFSYRQSNRTLTPLHLAVDRRCLDAVAWLIFYGANANLHYKSSPEDTHGLTPLQLATTHGMWDCAKIFLKPSQYLKEEYSSVNLALFYLFAAYSARNFLAIPIDVFAIILNHAFGHLPKDFYDFNRARTRFLTERSGITERAELRNQVALSQQETIRQQQAAAKSAADARRLKQLAIITRASEVVSSYRKFSFMHGNSRQAMQLMKDIDEAVIIKDADPQACVTKLSSLFSSFSQRVGANKSRAKNLLVEKNLLHENGQVSIDFLNSISQ